MYAPAISRLQTIDNLPLPSAMVRLYCSRFGAHTPSSLLDFALQIQRLLELVDDIYEAAEKALAVRSRAISSRHVPCAYSGLASVLQRAMLN